MFKKLTGINNTSLHLKTENITAVTTDATGRNTIVCQNGELTGFMVQETPEQVIAIIEGK
jgi:hypothetical protein